MLKQFYMVMYQSRIMVIVTLIIDLES